MKKSLASDTKYITVLIILVLMAGTLLRLNNLGNITFRTPDENIYTYQATKIAEFGREGIKLLVREYNADKKNWLYPSPVRIGYISLLAVVMKATNSFNDEKVGAYVSCFFSVIGLLMLIALGLKFFNPYITLFGIIFLSVSPMDLAIARRAWQDAMLGAIALLLVYITCEITRPGRKIIWYILFIFVGSCCMLVKESGFIVYALCLIWILLVLFFKKRSFLDGTVLTIAGILGAVASVLILAYAVGGFHTIVETLKHHLGSTKNNQYALTYQSGPWYNILLGLWILSPVNLILCFIGIVITFIRDKRLVIRGIASFMVIFLIIAILAPHFQNLRFLSVLYALFYLMAGTGLWYVFSFFKDKKNKFGIVAVILAIVILAAIRDYQTFVSFFVKTDLFDLSVNLLKEGTNVSNL